MSHKRNATRYKYNYWKQLQKKQGYICSYCGRRYKQNLLYSHIVHNLVCYGCDCYLKYGEWRCRSNGSM